MQSCRFCDISNGKYNNPGIDKPFQENHSFFAMASIGAIVEGWTLIVPKQHQLSMKDAYLNSDFASFADSVTTSLNKNYGSVIAFEHGANVENSPTSCGTNHAHLHFVPFADSLLSKMEVSGLNWSPCRSSEISKLTENKEYLFYIDLNERQSWKEASGYLHVLEEPKSQFFRRLIADHMGVSDLFNYRTHPFIENSERTRHTLAAGQ